MCIRLQERVCMKMRTRLTLTIDKTVLQHLKNRRINISRHVEKLVVADALGRMKENSQKQQTQNCGSNPPGAMNEVNRPGRYENYQV